VAPSRTWTNATDQTLGQWDVGSKWASEGCELGNCLRSHVNLAETFTALALITKAGVLASKVMVGITSYARSFKMAEVGCDGPDCLYLGAREKSEAELGYCTSQGGYIADAEIDQIKKVADFGIGGSYYEFYDEGSDSDIIVYDGVQWAAYMSESTKNGRVVMYKSMGFGGASDWAVDCHAAEGSVADRESFGEYEQTSECPVSPQPTGCLRTIWVHHGFPRRADVIETPDPKVIVDRARENMPMLEGSFDTTFMEVTSDKWDGTLADAVDVLATSVFMLDDAVTQMTKVKEVGQEWKEEKQKELAFKILEGVLFLVPFLGAGATGLTIYSIVEDPSMAPSPSWNCCWAESAPAEAPAGAASSAPYRMPQWPMG
jgi:hypothetical protein